MKKPLLWIAVVMIACLSSSCGLPGALLNSAGRMANGAANLIAPAE